ncbi:extracellular solute-binding protein [Oleiphilus sp. HI0086]|uniref:extracellular solute-binding protein n=1 Tax=Oleiphilus sp. HI0086 TaxID=1822260 RepID=UPI0007C29F80|nr:extracellular solute-binding protein [Oleiphilus sp. HI0086]KZY51520.1 hypothetical protein A3732_04120 [Oleiphilus sp. HI0050]KZZ33320.1 hypothetical protein A3756_04490 [Oleiphilus sp. HI0086]
MRLFRPLKLLVISISLPFCFTPAQAEELMVYSSRNASYLTPMFNRYASETGVSVSYTINSSEALIRKLEAEGEESPADIFLTTGALNLSLASQKGVLASISSRILKKTLPEHLRSKDDDWFAIAKRAQAIAYHPEKLSESELQTYANTYAALADSKWKGKLCLRSSRTEYSQSLLADLSHRYGEAKMKTVMKGWVSNLVHSPMSDDLELFTALETGACELTIAYSYYLPRHLLTHPNSKIKLFWPEQKDGGVHIDITGAGVVADSDNKELAQDFLEWMLSKQAQSQYSRLSMEYPAHRRVYPDRAVAKHGKFKENKAHVDEFSPYQSAANNIARKAKYK